MQPACDKEAACRSRQRLFGCAARQSDTLHPNFWRNQRENALSAENPSSSAIADRGRSRFST